MKARTSRPSWPGLIAIAIAALACGSSKTDDGSPTEKQGQDPNTVLLPVSIFLIDDFEKPESQLPGNTSVGTWYGYDDSSIPAGDPTRQFMEDATVDPHQTLATLPPSKHALHARGGPYDGWGSGFAHPILDLAPFNASAFDGVLLWAKKGTDASEVLTLSLPTADDTTTDQGGRCVDRPSGSSGRCYDAFHIDLALTDDWRFYKIPFRDLHQSGFGFVPPNGFDRSTIFSISFANLQGTTFNEWIDDVAFYSDKAGTTGAANDASAKGDTSTGTGGGSATDSGSDVILCKATAAIAITGQDLNTCKARQAEAGTGADVAVATCFACLCRTCPQEALTCSGNPYCKAVSDCCRNRCQCPAPVVEEAGTLEAGTSADSTADSSEAE